MKKAPAKSITLAPIQFHRLARPLGVPKKIQIPASIRKIHAQIASVRGASAVQAPAIRMSKIRVPETSTSVNKTYIVSRQGLNPPEDLFGFAELISLPLPSTISPKVESTILDMQI
jgi:hypothetical protein